MVRKPLANKGHSLNAVSMLGHCSRRWPNIERTLGEFPVFAGTGYLTKNQKNFFPNADYTLFCMIDLCLFAVFV